MENNEERRKSDLMIADRLARIETILNNGIKDELAFIRKQVINDLPHSIDALGGSVNLRINGLENELNNTKLKNTKWIVSILVSLVFILLGTMLNLIMMFLR